MTTTGDLFVNIKGNNQGLKRSLQQSSRDIKTFAKDTERQAKGGLGLTDMLALGAIFKGKDIAKAMSNLGSKQIRGNSPLANHPLFAGATGLIGGRTEAIYGKAVNNRRRRQNTMGNMLDAELRWERRHLVARGIDGGRSINSTRRAGYRDRFRTEERRMINLQAAQAKGAAARKFLLSATGAITSVAGAVAGGLLIANASKWQKRVNNATSMYSSAVLKNQARLDLKNLRKDIALSRDPAMQRSTIMRQNAADYRRNSGQNWSQLANVAGAGWDYFVGWAGNALSGSYVPRIGEMTTEQRLAKIQGGAI